MSDRAPAASHPPASAGRTFRTDVLIRFAHCDPAGIVFFPRYLEMFNNLVEDWCREELGFTFAEIHKGRGWGMPTVHLDVDFIAPSFIAEVLSASLKVHAIGRTSLTLAIEFRGPDGGERVRAQMVVVLTDPKSLRAVAIPDDLRTRIAAFHAAR
jgi:4-hydroxybenzoyl-CoA thioesterase